MVKNRAVPIVYGINKKFLYQSVVSIFSLIKNKNNNTYYEIYIMNRDLDHNDELLLKSLARDDAVINLISMHDFVNFDSGIGSVLFPIDVTFRYYIPELLPQYSKVLYLDADTVILDDLFELYDTNIDNNILAAIYEPLPNEIRDRYINQLKIDPDKAFNSGIMLINSEMFLNYGVKNKCLNLLEEDEDGKYVYVDQDPLNIVCQGKTKEIDWKWNLVWTCSSIPSFWTNIDDARKEVYRTKIEKAILEAKIIHYASDKKAIEHTNRYLADIFWKYASQTPVYNQLLEESKLYKKRNNFKLKFNLENNFSIISGRFMIYGAGEVGELCRDYIANSDNMVFVGWVDRNYNILPNIYRDVRPIESLDEKEYDYLIIALNNKNTGKRVKTHLIESGFSESKIKTIYEVCNLDE